MEMRENKEPKMPTADTGNASNSSPNNMEQGPKPDQLLDKKAETYLRESANIEDLPDAQDQQDMDESLERTN